MSHKVDIHLGDGMVSTVLKAKVKGIEYGFDSHRLHQIFSYLYNKNIPLSSESKCGR